MRACASCRCCPRPPRSSSRWRGDDVVGVTFECDLPPVARGPTGGVLDVAARGAEPGRDRRAVGAPRWRRVRTSTASTRTPSPTSTPTSSSPRTSARSALSTSPPSTTPGPPRLPRRGAHHRPAHPRRGARLHPRGRGVPERPRTRSPWSRRARAAGCPCARARAPVRAWSCSSGPTRRTRRALDPGVVAAAECRRSARRQRVGARRLGRRARPGPDVVVVAPCGFGLRGPSARLARRAASPPGRLPGGGPGLGGRRQRLVRPTRAAPGGRRGIEALAGILHADRAPDPRDRTRPAGWTPDGRGASSAQASVTGSTSRQRVRSAIAVRVVATSSAGRPWLV